MNKLLETVLRETLAAAPPFSICCLYASRISVQLAVGFLGTGQFFRVGWERGSVGDLKGGVLVTR